MKQVYIPELQVYSLYHGGRYLSREITAQEMAFLLLLLFPLESYPTNVTTPSAEMYCLKKGGVSLQMFVNNHQLS